MTTTSTSDAKDLITLAERMGIPADEAIRQVALLIADVDHAAPAAAGPTSTATTAPIARAVASSAVA